MVYVYVDGGYVLVCVLVYVDGRLDVMGRVCSLRRAGPCPDGGGDENGLYVGYVGRGMDWRGWVLETRQTRKASRRQAKICRPTRPETKIEGAFCAISALRTARSSPLTA